MDYRLWMSMELTFGQMFLYGAIFSSMVSPEYVDKSLYSQNPGRPTKLFGAVAYLETVVRYERSR